jgi:hypothetical protein
LELEELAFPSRTSSSEEGRSFSAYRKGLRGFFPERLLLKDYKTCGGKLRFKDYREA